MTNLFSAARLSSSAFVALSDESMHRRLCRISANNSISLPRIACVSTGSHGAKTANGWNGQRLTGNSLSTMCARDSSNLMGGSSWSSIDATTVLHFSHRNCARFLIRKARGSFVGRPCLQQIRLRSRASSRYEIVGQAHRLPAQQREQLSYNGVISITISNLSNPSPAIAQL